MKNVDHDSYPVHKLWYKDQLPHNPNYLLASPVIQTIHYLKDILHKTQMDKAVVQSVSLPMTQDAEISNLT